MKYNWKSSWKDKGSSGSRLLRRGLGGERKGKGIGMIEIYFFILRRGKENN